MSFINIQQARENNLKDVSINIPHNKITCFTGVSGSGKSSLVYDVIFRESQRRYFESFSSYARQFFGKTSRPEVGRIEGLMPAITVDQKTVYRNPRSTVGTMSELYDYLRLLFARLGETPEKNLKISRSLFSFNSPEGCCSRCKGLGVEDEIDPDLLIKDPAKSLREGALKITTPSGYTIYSQVTIDVMQQVCRSEGFNVDIPWNALTEEQKDIILHGSNKIKIPYGKHPLASRLKWSGITAKPREEGYYKGILPVMENILKVDRNPNILRFARTVECKSCNGKRLNEQSLQVTFKGKNISEFAGMTIDQLSEYFSNLQLLSNEKQVGEEIRLRILERCKVIQLLGLGYLTISRESTTLSGGEGQRIRLATQIGTGIRGVLYVLDEPSVGLHPFDNEKMIKVIRQLRNQGNTVLVVEHDKDTILNADEVVDMGPEAGKNGGRILFRSPVEELENLSVPESKTIQFLKKNPFTVPPVHPFKDGWLHLKRVSLHNLKNTDVSFRLHALNVVTGVSGAGKSTLVMDVLGESLLKWLNKEFSQNPFQNISGHESIKKVVEIDQQPIGRTPRSNPATYTKLFDLIRKLFAELPESKKRGWKQGHFSFNTKGGRCEKCEGAGIIQTGMHFLGNVVTVCESCNGKRFDTETLKIKYKGKNISDILDMEISEAVSFFEEEKKIHQYLTVLQKIGLGYMHLGQSATSLSGGEAQRLKLAAELVKPSPNHTLYIFDEPTTGLHAYDVKVLLLAMNRLVLDGHTVIVVEHHENIIKAASHIVDLGPEGGEKGGKVVFSGTPEEMLNTTQTLTAIALQSKSEIVKEKYSEEDHEKVINGPVQLLGVNTHNLKNLDVVIPRNKLTVLTGVSGSGKSSLAFDTLFAEGQFRFTESFSTYSRRLMQQKDKPDIRESFGITPSIAVDSHSVTRHPRATVGTVTGIYDLYRLLFSRFSSGSLNHKEDLFSSLFSFNHEAGACPYCKGLGYHLAGDPDRIVTNPELSILNGALHGTKPGQFYGDPFGQYIAILKSVGEKKDINFSKPWDQLSDEEKRIAMEGTGEEEYDVNWNYKRKSRSGVHEFSSKWPGFLWYIEDEYERKHKSDKSKVLIELMKEKECPVCKGSRLKEEVLQYKIDGLNIHQLSLLEAKKALPFFQKIRENINKTQQKGSSELINGIIERLNQLIDIGLGYLSVDRSSMSLSGGEARRVRLLANMGGELTGLTYVLDEPTIGLHKSDNIKLLALLKQLSRDNTVVVVEHDADIIREGENIIELGPGAGEKGGEIIAQGTLPEILQNANSITAKYLKSSNPFVDYEKIDISNTIKIKNARVNNLKNIDVEIAVPGITLLHGVSGCGKTSLMFDVLVSTARLGRPVHCDEVTGLELFESVVAVDQSPVSTSLLSIPATFLGIFDNIRKLFATTKKARAMKYRPSHFSFNSKGGRCEKCKGQGKIKTSMDFLADIYTVCSECEGSRYSENVLEVKWNKRSIDQILDLTITKSTEVFKEEHKIVKALLLMEELGLGHLKLGQPTGSLSGGETQRLKLAKELLKIGKGRNLYLLDEPTTGLHFRDIERLISLLNRLVHQGHSVLLIEHHHWFLQVADYRIELGPTGGEEGGHLQYCGKNS